MSSEAQRRFRRSKESERDLGRWLLKHDGLTDHWKAIASSTGRVGQITGLQFDCVSDNYAAENKQVKLPATIFKWWLQINQIAQTHHKDALLRIEPTNEVKSIIGVPKGAASLHIITEERHAELLRKEKAHDILLQQRGGLPLPSTPDPGRRGEY